MELIVRHDGREERLWIERRDHGYEVRLGGRVLAVDVCAVVPGVRSLIIDGRQYEVGVRSLGNGTYQVSSRGGLEEVEVADPLTDLAREAQAAREGGGARRVTAYMPGRVVAVLVAEGDEVESGQGLLVLEAMKMENEIRAESAGTVRRILVSEGAAVEGGDALMEIE